MRVLKADEAFYVAEQRVRRWLEQDQPVRIFGTAWTLEPEVKFGRVEDVQPYVDRVLAHIGCEHPIRVRARRGASFAHYERLGAVMAVPSPEIGGKWALREIVILHEIAHHLSPAGERHGKAFERAMCGLLRDVGHPTTARLLEIAAYEEREAS